MNAQEVDSGNTAYIPSDNELASLLTEVPNPNAIVRNINIPNNITPGRYQLRIVIRQMGGEWRIATLSHNNTPTSIDFTVR